jgi:catechol 2,3-dioxygenase-like lactoylglutathione lyase family enzyme
MKKLRAVTLITNDVPRLRSFYRALLQVSPFDEGDEHTSFVLDGLGLNIFATRGMEHFAPGSMAHAGNGNAVLEVEVEDTDAEYRRLVELGAVIVTGPTTYEWGQRAVWFRDPDGNIISFACAVK